MRTILWVLRSKIGFTIALLIAALFVAMSFSGIQNNRLYIILAQNVQISIDKDELSTYTLLFNDVKPNVLQVPPAADGLPLLVPVYAFLSTYANMSPGQFNIILTYQSDADTEKAISIFEAYDPLYDPIKNTITLTAKIFSEYSIPNIQLNDVTAFISLK